MKKKLQTIKQYIAPTAFIICSVSFPVAANADWFQAQNIQAQLITPVYTCQYALKNDPPCALKINPPAAWIWVH